MSEDALTKNVAVRADDLRAQSSGADNDYHVSPAHRFDLDEIRQVTQITDKRVLTELMDCGVRAESLNLLTLVPLVHVAWSNGRIEDEERVAILAVAAQAGVQPDSPGYALLNGWLCCRPDRTLIRTWKDYVAAIQKFLSPEAFTVLHLSTLNRAWIVAEAAGGLLGFLKVSRAEEAAIQELNLAFRN